MFSKAIILAGGEGIRMRPITNSIPKALAPINDSNLITQVISFLNKNNISDIYVTYNYLSEILFSSLKHKVNGFINTINKDNSYFLFNSIIKDIDEPIIIIPCDILIDIDLFSLYNDYFLLNQPLIMMVGVSPIEDIQGDYITFDRNNIITSLSRNTPTDLYASGLQIINPKKINLNIESNDNFNNVWFNLIKHNELKVSNITPTKWCAYDNINNLNKYGTI